MKKWIIKQLINCKWLKEALYEAIYAEYVEKLRKKNIAIMGELDEAKVKLNSLTKELEKKTKELAKLKDDLVKLFPVGKFEEVMAKLKELAEKFFPVKKEEEAPKKKRNKKKKAE